MENFIQQFLDAQLFNIADNEERLEKLLASAESLSDAFIENNSLLLQFLRASLVPNVDENSLVLSQIEAHIKKDWSTFLSAQRERPTAINLAVGWQAARRASEKDTELCALLWYGSANLLLDSKVDPLSNLVIDFVKSQGVELERRAVAEWSPYTAKTIKQVKAVAMVEVKNTLQIPLLKASAAVDPSTGSAVEGGNTHQPSTDGNWAAFFSKHASSGITNSIAQVTKAVLESVQSSIDDLSKKVTATSAELNRSHTAQSRRTELLWLSESLYSTRLKKGYRELTPNETIVSLTSDVAEIATGLSPQSVEYFLADKISRLLPSDEIKLESFVRELSGSAVRVALPTQLFIPIQGTKRIGLLEFAGALAAGQTDIKKFIECTGFPKSKSMSASALARWVFREIKCAECINKELWS
ncbi:hypothetical protein VN12_23535 [Pirellula sp. SH-Sr6A]|uniref:GTPase-associated system all-helical protein GASH n=1 Tax=Pirellula sp. SH-Sr6A TaxID=1632865 RepID=UPI00078ED129|nr:GTPase-associated system all-helical protein GASH [Pirellula sp. SH-Sr6A]AMV35119.1 hypothetical protein VN12_23535 [Pirellula sp. SH-Sr6A]